MNFYKIFIRPILFLFDSEIIHEFSFKFIKLVTFLRITFILKIFCKKSSKLHVNIAGIEFSNPIMLAAGFDKQVYGFNFFESLGFSAVEMGTITSEFQLGNPKPRIFRLPKDRALINRMGFPSAGIENVKDRLISIFSNRRSAKLGINIGKAKSVAIEDASENYKHLFENVAPYADYVTINISSPNTPELRKLQEPDRLLNLFETLRHVNINCPIFVKIAPDLTDIELENICRICMESKIDGIIATNTTVSREGILTKIDENGGLSGIPLKQKSLEIVSKIRKMTDESYPIIGVGGIFCCQDLLDYLKAGANAVQIYTGFIYEGPWIVNTILSDLSQFMERHSLNSIDELSKFLSK